MSVKISSWVWEHSEAKGNELLILLALADQADDAGVCWPSVASLAAKTRLSERTIQTYLRALEDAGILSIEERLGTSNRYTIHSLHPRSSRTPADSAPVQPVAPGGATARTPGVQTAAPYTSLNHQEPSLPSLDAREAVELEVPDDASESLEHLFDRFWKLYPRRTAKADAVKAYPRALKVHGGSVGHAAASIENAIRAHAAHWVDVEQRPIDRIPYPATWLNGQRWNDELHDPPPPPQRAPSAFDHNQAIADQLRKEATNGPGTDRRFPLSRLEA